MQKTTENKYSRVLTLLSVVFLVMTVLVHLLATGVLLIIIM